MVEKIVHFFSKISVRLLAFNALIVFLPAAAILYLGTYEKQLLQALEHALVQQGRVFAAALANGPVLDELQAEQVIRNMEKRLEARIRVLGPDGRLIADSSTIDPQAAEPAEIQQEEVGKTRTPAEERVLYQVASRPILAITRFFQPPREPIQSAEFYIGTDRLLGSEVQAALQGRYGAATRISSGGQRSVTLFSAIPVMYGGTVTGVILVSQSTYRILRDLYELRLDIVQIFLVSLAAAIVLSFVASLTISFPLQKLRRQALEVLDHRGRLVGDIQALRGRDEIADLSRSLREMTRKLRGHLDFVESFAADVSHEFKNPLASIRTSAEMIDQSDSDEDRTRFTGIVQREVVRMQNLLSALRDISMLDAGLDDEKRMVANLVAIVESACIAMREHPANTATVTWEWDREDIPVKVTEDRLHQVFQNLLENAVSFSSEIHVSVSSDAESAIVTVDDNGPGIPESHMTRVFDRFFSYRPNGGGHMGLGLSIVKAVVEGYGGTVAVSNRRPSGTRFAITLPVAYQ